MYRVAGENRRERKEHEEIQRMVTVVSSSWSSIWAQVASGDVAHHRSSPPPPPEVRIRGFRYALGRAKASSAFPVTFSFRLVNCRAEIRPSLLARNWNFVGIATGKPPNSTTTIFLSRIYRPSLLILFSPLSKYYSFSWFSYIEEPVI